jgi:hypothetical protein
MHQAFQGFAGWRLTKLAGEYNTLGNMPRPQSRSATTSISPMIWPRLAWWPTRRKNSAAILLYFNAYSPLNATTTPNFASQYAD